MGTGGGAEHRTEQQHATTAETMRPRGATARRNPTARGRATPPLRPPLACVPELLCRKSSRCMCTSIEVCLIYQHHHASSCHHHGGPSAVVVARMTHRRACCCGLRSRARVVVVVGGGHTVARVAVGCGRARALLLLWVAATHARCCCCGSWPRVWRWHVDRDAPLPFSLSLRFAASERDVVQKSGRRESSHADWRVVTRDETFLPRERCWRVVRDESLVPRKRWRMTRRETLPRAPSGHGCDEPLPRAPFGWLVCVCVCACACACVCVCVRVCVCVCVVHLMRVEVAVLLGDGPPLVELLATGDRVALGHLPPPPPSRRRAGCDAS